MNLLRRQSMSKVLTSLFTAALLALSATSFAAEASNGMKRNLNIGFVNFKTCVEQSKLGKQEQATFEGMKKQMEAILEEKEKALNEIATKFNDPDFLDSLAPEAETELKRKFRALSQEMAQQQQQYYQTLQQANYKIVQKLTETIAKATEEVAKEKKLDIVLNEDSCFFCMPELNVSSAVVVKMDEVFDKEAKEKPAQAQPAVPAMLPAKS